MFNSKVVFVLGAGASAEVGMPVGRGLADAIAKKMEVGPDSIGRIEGPGDVRLFTELAPELGSKALRTAERLRDGLPFVKSIDEFLDFNSADAELVKLGKASIVKTILEMEARTHLAAKDGQGRNFLSLDGISKTWLVKLMRMLGQGDPQRLLENVTFIVFNYDRCLEFFLLHAVRALYGLNDTDARGLVAQAKIFHPYGSVAPLRALDASGLSFGQAAGPVSALAKRIKTYTEEVQDVTRMKGLHDEVAKASALVFLGFAFHEPNMKLLRPAVGLGAKKVFATGLGISNADAAIVTQRILSLFDDVAAGNVMRADLLHLHRELTCAELLDEYALTLPAL